MSDQTVSRRNLLKTTGIVGVGALILGGGFLGLRSCQRDEGDLGEAEVDDLITLSDELGPYAVWREMQTFLRASPDHSLGKAKALVEGGSVEALHHFVRDEIRLVPSGRGKHFGFGASMRWGPRAALRAGAGSAREKAEILADLIRQSGRKADVVETESAARAQTPAIFFRGTEQAFAPPVSDSVLQNWRKRLGARPEETVSYNIDDHEEMVTDTLDELRALALVKGVPLGWNRFDDRPYGRVPVVRFEEADGGIFYADPVRPEAEITSEAGKVWDAEAPTGMLPVSVSLAFTTTADPRTPVEIARADWTAEDVCGRQVRVAFKPLQKMEEVIASKLGDLRTFTPFLSIQALDSAELDPAVSAVMGDTFTLSADLLKMQADGTVTLNGENIGDGALSGRASEVVSVEVEADATRYPDMRLLVRPRNAAGQIVDGLSAGEFAVSDEGEARQHLLRVRDRAPSILFLSDSSMSMPREYRGEKGELMQALVERVERIGKEFHPDTKVVVKTTNSNLWEHVMKTLGTKVDLIVYATDGHVDGWKPTLEERAPLSSGPRVIMMNVRGNTQRWRDRFRTNVFDEIADAANGLALDVEEEGTGTIEEAIHAFLAEVTPEMPYVLGYHVLGTDRGLRTAGVTVGTATGSAEYDAGTEKAPQQVMAALHLTVKIGDREVVRVLAGHDGVGDVTQADIDHLAGGVLGTHILAFEGPPPSFSTLLDDVLMARLSLENLDKAAGAEDGTLSFLPILQEGFHVMPGELATLLMRTAPLVGENFCFSEQGMRCVLYSSHPIMNDDKVITRVDIMPTSKTYVISPDTDLMIHKSLEASLRLAAAEAALFPQGNTFSLLEGKKLTEFDTSLYGVNAIERADREAWERFRNSLRGIIPHPGHRLYCAQDMSTRASWMIDWDTVEAYAILPDLSGGGTRQEKIAQQLRELDQVVSMLNLMIGGIAAAGLLNPIGAAALGVVAVYGQNLARMYAAASMAIILMDDSGIEPAVKMAIASMACNVVKTIGLGIFGLVGQTASRAVDIFTAGDNMIGMTGASSPFSCPI